VLGDAQLSSTARSLIEDVATTKLVSPAVYWELAIKISIGKYKLNEPFESFLDRGIIQNGFQILPIEPRHAAELTTLPFHHRDPFDRLIIAQAIIEQIPVISADIAFDDYSVKRLW
jgi:PIN domain nuclease of toxin-antitoxin system